jgi:hypothetical protein
MKPLSQQDPRWGRNHIGETNMTLARWGCTITSLCMALGILQDRWVSPIDAAKYWEFNGRGEILWRSCRFNGMNFLRRHYGHDRDEITYHANQEDKAVILEVNTSHWVYVRSMEGNKYVIWDPIDGTVHIGLPSKYRVTGFATFERSYAKPSEWMAEAWAKAKARGLKEEDPLNEINMPIMEDILMDLGLIDKVEGSMTVGRFLVIMEKIKDRW